MVFVLPDTLPALGGGTAPVTVTPPPAPAHLTLAQALTMPGVVWNAGIDLLAADEATPLEPGGAYDLTAADRMLPGSATMTLDVSMTTLRTLSFSLRTSDGRYLPGAAGAPSGGAGSPLATGLTWFGVRYRPWLDVQVGAQPGSGAPLWQRTFLGVYVLTQPQITLNPQQSLAQLTLGDKSVLLLKPYVLTASNLPQYTASGGHAASGYAKGSTFDEAMRDMATRGGVPAGRLHFEPSAMTLPDDYAVVEGDEPWVHLQTLAAAMPHVCYFDALGNLVRRQNPLAVNTPSVWTFAPGPLATVGQVQRTTDFTSTYNHIIVLGGSSSTQLWRGEAQLNDASSPYHMNEIGDRITFWGQNGLGDLTPDPTIGSTAAAQAKAAVLLAQHLGQQEAIQIQCRTLPQLAPYDRITAQLAGAGLNTDAQVTQATITLDTTGQMTLTGAKWIAVGS